MQENKIDIILLETKLDVSSLKQILHQEVSTPN